MSQITILEQPESVAKFIAVCKAVRRVNDEDAQQIFEVEKFNFLKTLSESESLKNCSDISKIGVFLEVISNGLSFDKSAKHIYLIPRGKVLTYSYQSDGIIYLCTEAQSINHCTTPVIVYEGDTISVGCSNGETTISHSKAIPRTSNKIIGGYCFVSMRMPNGSEKIVPFWMDINESERLLGFSKKGTGGRGNALYTSGPDGQIDEGFFRTKIVKAALRNVKRKKTLSENYTEYDEVEEELAAIESSDIAAEKVEHVEESAPAEATPMMF